jgi:hypothetical protein
MILTLSIVPAGNTTPREVSAATDEARHALERTRGVERALPQRVAAPEQAKGMVDALGKLAVTLAPTALKGALQVLQTTLAGQPPTKILIEHKDTKFSFEFDPRKTSLADLVSAAERLRAAAEAA